MDGIPAYDPDLYVAPKDTHQWLLGRVKAWKAGHSRTRGVSSGQVLVLAGERGSGKSWLLQHVADRDRRLVPPPIYLDLQQRTDVALPEDYARVENERIRKRRGSAPGVILLDHVPPQLDDHLRALEEMVLRPQLANCGALIVMALTHPSHVCWRTAVLRSGDRWLLTPFAGSQTQEQVRRLEKAGLLRRGVKAATVQRHGGGSPLLNYLLCTHDRLDAFELLLRYWLARVPEPERESIQGYLEAVCALDVLEHAAIRRALVIYQRCRPLAPGYPIHPIGLRNVLQKHWLAQPSPLAPGQIVLLAGARGATQELLKTKDADLYAELVGAALSSERGQE